MDALLFILITVVYLMQNAGIEITPMTLVIWVFIATIAAIGNAGVPMGCFLPLSKLACQHERSDSADGRNSSVLCSCGYD